HVEGRQGRFPADPLARRGCRELGRIGVRRGLMHVLPPRCRVPGHPGGAARHRPARAAVDQRGPSRHAVPAPVTRLSLPDMPDQVAHMTPVTDYREIADVLASADFARTDLMTTPFKLETISLTSGEEHSFRRRLEARHFRPAVLRGTRAAAVQAAIELVLGEAERADPASDPITVELAEVL